MRFHHPCPKLTKNKSNVRWVCKGDRLLYQKPLGKKCRSIENYLARIVGTPLHLIANNLLFFCRDSTVFIFLSLLAVRPNTKSGQDPRTMGRVTYSSCPLYSFTWNNKPPCFKWNYLPIFISLSLISTQSC